MSLYEPFPDAEALVSSVIRNEVIVLNGRVYSSVPAKPTYPLCVVHRIGGVPVERHRLDLARIQVDVWGTSKSEAFDIIQEARAAVHGMEHTAFTEDAGDPVDGYVTAVRDDLGLTWLPDQPTGRDRYVMGVAVYLKPLVSTS